MSFLDLFIHSFILVSFLGHLPALSKRFTNRAKNTNTTHPPRATHELRILARAHKNIYIE